MNRIWFRVWDDYGKTMIYLRPYTLDWGKLEYDIPYDFIMRYIGVRGRKNEYIWESDIVENKFSDSDNKIFIVKYCNEEASFVLEDVKGERFDSGDVERGFEVCWKDCKVIGNIYENSELLKSI